MRVLGLTMRNSGCGFHRVCLPLDLMDNVKGINTDRPKEDQQFDILLFNRLTYYYDADINKAREIYGCKLVMDLDDDWILPVDHVLHYNLKKIEPFIENNLRNADMVTCTNQRLAEKIFPFNNNVHILPNAIPYGYHQFNTDKVQDEKIRLFWCGSITHEYDLALLRYPLQRIQGQHQKIKMVIGGYSASNPNEKYVWDRMVRIFTNNLKLPYEVYKGLLPEMYMEIYNFADICLIPLEKSDWHACKSNLKILEAATKKCPVIVSNVEPYNVDKNMPVLWANNSADWYKHMNYLINNKNARIDYGEALHEYCKEHYNYKQINDTRRSAFASLINV